MKRLIPPILTALAVWALILAESQAEGRPPLNADDPACAGADLSDDQPVPPGCPDPIETSELTDQASVPTTD